MSVLNLFPPRVAFVNPDGTLTSEAWRALNEVETRVGGPLGVVPGEPKPVEIEGDSPFEFKASGNGSVVVTGGTVTALEYGRGADYVNLGALTGCWRLLAGDRLRVHFAVAPAITFLSG